MVQLRLTGTAVQTLADNAHLPGWPRHVDPGLVADGDPDADLHRAAARWYRAATVRRLGRGTVYLGEVPASDAAEILEYLDAVARALLSASGVTARAEGRAVGRCVDQAVAHLRRAGVGVVEHDRARGRITLVEG